GARLGIMGFTHRNRHFLSREAPVAKPELGTKRLCPNCSTKYYDLNRDPILCPKCGTPFTIAALALRAKAAPIAEEEEEEEAAALPVD
ncbi:TIGR02300 family protein, partial [Acinetobacter baumannii]